MALQINNNLLNRFTEIITELHLCESMEYSKMEMLVDKLEEIKKFKDKLADLDLDYKEYMEETKNDNDVIPTSSFQDRMNDIDDDSLIIYVTKAQLYKIYKAENLDDFQNDDNTHFRRRELGPVYEVVRDSNPQKLTIVIKNGLLENKIQDVKECIVDFAKRTPTLSGITTSDLIVFNSDNNTEFLVGGLKLKNISEKEKIIESFIKYMRQKKESDISNRIELRAPPCDELEGARLYKIPSLKVQLGGNTSNLVDQLITTTVPSSQNPVVINNTFIIQNNSNNVINSNNNNRSATVNNSNTSSTKTLKMFYKHLYDTRPDWYIENSVVEMSVIEAAYRTYFEDHVTSKQVISRQLNGSLFQSGKRQNNIVKKTLVSFVNLKKLFQAK